MSVANSFPRLPLLDVSRVGGIAALVGSKAADVSISLAVLRAYPTAEVNPIARLAFAEFGDVGLVGMAIFVITVIIGAVEFGAVLLDHFGAPDLATIGLRVGCYGLASLIWLAAVVNNVVLVSGAL